MAISPTHLVAIWPHKFLLCDPLRLAFHAFWRFRLSTNLCPTLVPRGLCVILFTYRGSTGAPARVDRRDLAFGRWRQNPLHHREPRSGRPGESHHYPAGAPDDPIHRPVPACRG